MNGGIAFNVSSIQYALNMIRIEYLLHLVENDVNVVASTVVLLPTSSHSSRMVESCSLTKVNTVNCVNQVLDDCWHCLLVLAVGKQHATHERCLAPDILCR